MASHLLALGAKGGGVMLLGNALSILIQIASVVALSRILSPDDFGLVAMAGVFLALGNLLRDFGMPLAALQARDLTRQQASNLFWVNTALSAATTAALILAAPVIALAVREPRLALVIPGLAAALLVNGMGAQMQTHLARELRFITLVATELAGQVTGLAVAVACALTGLGFWALVAQGLSASLMTHTGRWISSRWLPIRFRRGAGSATLVKTGTQYGFAQLLTFLQNNADSLVIGSFLGTNALGYYSRSYQLLTAPAARLLDPLTQVVVPLLNAVRTDGRPFEPALLRVQFLVGSGMVAVFATAGGSALTLVPFILGEGWAPSSRVFAILTIGGAVWVFSHVSYWAFLLYGQGGQLLSYNLVSKPMAVLCIAVGAAYGIEGVAWGYVAGMALSWPLNLVWLARSAGLPSMKFARNGITILAAGFVNATLCRWITEFLALGAAWRLAIAGFVGMACMVLVLLLFPHTRVLLGSSGHDLKTLLRR